MAFDLSKVLEQANKVSEGSNDNREGQARIVYPGPGELKVKLLINPKSGIVTRQTRRHDINGVRFVCPNMYDRDCPACITLKSIETTLGKDVPWTLKSKFRGISYAQYIGSSSDYDWSSSKEPEVGELILLMYPWSVYSEINELISGAGAKADQLISMNESKIFIIKRSMENKRVTYKVSIDPFDSYKSFPTEEEFIKFLEDTPSLADTVSPSTMQDDVVRKAQEVAISLEMTYLGGRLGAQQSTMMAPGSGQPIQQQPPIQQQQLAQQAQQPAQQQQQQQQPAQQPQASSVGGSNPECFGSHQPNEVKCLSCLQEHQCTLVS